MDYKNPLKHVPSPSTLTNYLSICVFHLFHTIICAKLRTFHSVPGFCVYMFSVNTHTLMYIFYIYLLTFLWERGKGIFAIGFSCNSVGEMLLLFSLQLGFESIMEWGTSQGSTIFIF